MLKQNPLVSVAVYGHVAEAATRQSPAPPQKHSLGGCTVELHRRTAYRFAARYLLFGARGAEDIGDNQ